MEKIEKAYNEASKRKRISKDIDVMYKEIERPMVDKKILNEIAVYTSNGMDEKDIGALLNMSVEEIEKWKEMCPEVMGAFSIGAKAVSAKVMLTKVQLALGGRKVKKQQAVKVGDYEDGRKIGEHIEIVEVWEELAPNYQACEEILSAKEPDTWNKKKLLEEKEKEQRAVISDLTPEQKIAMLKAIDSQEQEGAC